MSYSVGKTKRVELIKPTRRRQQYAMMLEYEKSENITEFDIVVFHMGKLYVKDGHVNVMY